MENLYGTLAPLKVSDEVVRHIKTLVTAGKLHPGQKFPAERTLAGKLGVGRSTLREAMQTLSVLGFVEIKPRRGIFVRSVGSSLIPESFAQIMDDDQTRIRDLYELRGDLEVASAYVAAQRRDIRDLDSMERMLDRLEAQIDAPQLGLAEDMVFHLAIARAGRNLLRVHVLENLFDRYGHYIDMARKPLLNEPGHNRTVYAHHRKIFEGIRQKQPDEARHAMQAHLSWVTGRWPPRTVSG